MALMFGALTIGVTTARGNTPPTILFVCQAGTVKSPVARELLRRLRRRGTLQSTPNARGIAPENHMTPQLAAALKADGIDLASEPVLALTAADLKAADIIVVFNPLPARLGTWRVRDWTDLPSMNRLPRRPRRPDPAPGSVARRCLKSHRKRVVNFVRDHAT